MHRVRSQGAVTRKALTLGTACDCRVGATPANSKTQLPLFVALAASNANFLIDTYRRECTASNTSAQGTDNDDGTMEALRASEWFVNEWTFTECVEISLDEKGYPRVQVGLPPQNVRDMAKSRSAEAWRRYRDGRGTPGRSRAHAQSQ